MIDYQKKQDIIHGNIQKYKDLERELRQQAADARDNGDMELRKQLLTKATRVMQEEWKEACTCQELRKKQKQLQALVGQSNMPEKFLSITVNDFNEHAYKLEQSLAEAAIAKRLAVNYVKKFEYVKKQSKGLYLYSRTKGAGKTLLACAIANDLMSTHNQSVLYTKAADISLKIRATYNDKEKSEEDVLRAFREVDVLIIDDFITEVKANDKTGFNEKILYQIIDYRLEQQKLTLITSNVELTEISMYYPDPSDPSSKGRLESRINKMCYPVTMPEESVRDLETEQENAALEDILLFGE